LALADTVDQLAARLERLKYFVHPDSDTELGEAAAFYALKASPARMGMVGCGFTTSTAFPTL